VNEKGRKEATHLRPGGALTSNKKKNVRETGGEVTKDRRKTTTDARKREKEVGHGKGFFQKGPFLMACVQGWGNHAQEPMVPTKEEERKKTPCKNHRSLVGEGSITTREGKKGQQVYKAEGGVVITRVDTTS